MTATSTLTLSAFLLARYDEWEATALGADGRQWHVALSGNIKARGGVEVTWADSLAPWTHDLTATHIAHNDPAFVLAQVASLRAVVERYELVCREDEAAWEDYSNWLVGDHTSPKPPERTTGEREQGGLYFALLALTQPFRDHHDMRAEWVTG